jgi:plastocyanin
MTALPLANAQSTVMVSIPSGSGASQSAAPGYSPDTITLVIGVNNTVTWTNNDTVHHTVTSVSGNGSISSGDMAPAATYSYTFTTPGTYQYFCVYHSWMTGVVIVKAASTVPEFPAAYLALTLFAAIAAVIVVAPRLRPMLSPGAANGTT